jgi:hypothetical protein
MTLPYEGTSNPSSPVEDLLQDQLIQDGLRGVFSELDNLYDGISNQTRYSRKGWDACITPDGTFIEAGLVATPLPGEDVDFRSTEYGKQVAEHHETAEYMVFMFNLTDLKSKDFQLKPAKIQGVEVSRGSGIDITIDNPSDPEPPFPREDYDENGRAYTDEEFDAFEVNHTAWRNRNVVHLPQLLGDTVRLGEIVAEPF